MVPVNQDFRITLDSGMVITGATTANIRYVKPGGTEQTVAGTIIDSTKVYYDFPAAVNDTAGKWKFRLDIVLGGFQYFSIPPVYINVRNSWYPWSDP